MARRKADRRIEPRFDAGDGARDELALSEDDRVLPARRPRQAPGKAPRDAKAARPAKAAREPAARPRRRKRGFFATAVRRLAYWTLVLGIWAGIAAACMVVWYGAQMPSIANWEVPDRPPNVRIVSVDGQLVANRGMTGGEALALREMSPFIPQAVIAIEDRRFRSHFGVDPVGLARAMLSNITSGSFSQGGSTLTQQLAKNLFLRPDRTLERKVQEVLLALWLERNHTKDEILELYLNRVYFGSGAYGVEAASRRYFGKSAREVTLAEAALLAGLLKAPSRLSPARDPKAAAARADVVLGVMREQGLIDGRQLAGALDAPTARPASYWTGSEHYVADKVMDELPGLVGEIGTDLIVETTVDMHLQQLAERSIRRLVDENRDKASVSQGVLVSLDNTGAVRAMVGGYDYANSQFDRATQAKRQPGSAFKPFVFMAALEQGLTPATHRRDAPVRIGKWQPANFNDKYYGDVTLAEALAKSLNSVAVRLVDEVGYRRVIDAAYRLGIESELQKNASIALGTSEVTPLELTAAFVPFANGGYRPFIHFIERVTTAGGEVLWERRSGGIPRVVAKNVVAGMNEMMTGTLREGTARKAAFGWPAAGKTGTSQGSRDIWFVGYTANLTTGVWFGNDDGKPTKNLTGGSLPAIAWHDFMVAAHEGLDVRPLPAAPFVAPIPPLRDGFPVAVDDRTASIGAAEAAPPSPPTPRRVDSILDVLLGN